MDLPTRLPPRKRALLENLVGSLSHVPGMQAIVLGGSYASGTQHRGSDMDIGLYYLEARPFSIQPLREIAQGISRKGIKPTVTGFYEWGAWVNGGAWIQTEAGKVDFLYRNLDQVRKTIQEAQQGICRHDYDQQPTHGFYSVGYLAETQICLPLFDPENRIAELKKQVEGYPIALKQRIVADSLWAAEFTLTHAHDFAERGDVYNTAGCLSRAAANLTQALFALNESYFLSDKKVMQTIARFKILPGDYTNTILTALACPGGNPFDLKQSVACLVSAWQGVALLAGDLYQPRF